ASPAARIGVGLIWRKKATRGNPSSQLKPCAARDTHKCFLAPRFHAGPGRGDWRYDTRPGAADDDGQINRTRVRHASASAPRRAACATLLSFASNIPTYSRAGGQDQMKPTHR